jgi:hypothetical protein
MITSTPDASYAAFVIESYRISGGGSGYAGAGTPVFALWQRQVEVLPFATSRIETPSSGTVTRTADNLSIPLHQASTNKDLLPYLFGPLPNPANKLTISFDAKCEYSSTSVEANWLTISGGPVSGPGRGRFRPADLGEDLRRLWPRFGGWYCQGTGWTLSRSRTDGFPW